MQLKFTVLMLQFFITLLFCAVANGQVRVFECRKPEALSQTKREAIIQNIRQIIKGDESVKEYKLGELDSAWHSYYSCLGEPQTQIVDSTKEQIVRREAEARKLQDVLDSLQINENTSEANTLAAQVAFLLYKDTEAVRYAEKGVELDSANFEAHYVLAVLKNDLAGADRAVKLNSSFAPAYIRKIQILLNQAANLEGKERRNKQEAALETIKNLLALPSPTDTEFWQEQKENLSAYLKSQNASNIKSSNPSNSDQNQAKTKLKIISQPKAGYTELARFTGTQGVVRLRVTFSAEGQVKNIVALTHLPFGLTKQSIAAAKKIIFEPETSNGMPVSVNKTVEYGFNIY